MYHYLRGQLISNTPQKVILEVRGVGYTLSIPFSTYEKLSERPLKSSSGTGEVLLYTHLYVREDQLKLYGFTTEGEKEFFRLLLSVSGVGPSLALAILSSSAAGELQQAILSENIGFLKQIKGVGKKTAQKIILELKDKVTKIQIFSPVAGKNTGKFDDAFLGLLALGYSDERALQALNSVRKEVAGDVKTDELIRLALKYV